MLTVYLLTVKPHYSPHRRPFRFEAMWLGDPRCVEVVQEHGWKDYTNQMAPRSQTVFLEQK